MKKNSLFQVGIVKVALTATFLLPAMMNAYEVSTGPDQVADELNRLRSVGQSSAKQSPYSEEVQDWYTQLTKLYGPAIQKLNMYSDWIQGAGGLVKKGEKAVADKSAALLGKNEKDLKAAKGIVGTAASQAAAISAPVEQAQVPQQCKANVDMSGAKQVLTVIDSAANSARSDIQDLNEEGKKKLVEAQDRARQQQLAQAIPQLNEFMEMAKKIPGIAMKLQDPKEAGKVLNFAVNKLKDHFEQDVSKQTIVKMLGQDGVFAQLDKLEALEGDITEVKQNFATILSQQGSAAQQAVTGPISQAETNCRKVKDQLVKAGTNIVRGIKDQTGVTGGFVDGDAQNEQRKFATVTNVTCDGAQAKAKANEITTVTTAEVANVMKANSVRALRNAMINAMGAIPSAMLATSQAIAAFNQNECGPLQNAMDSINKDSERSQLASGARSQQPGQPGQPSGARGGNPRRAPSNPFASAAGSQPAHSGTATP